MKSRMAVTGGVIVAVALTLFVLEAFRSRILVALDRAERRVVWLKEMADLKEIERHRSRIDVALQEGRAIAIRCPAVSPDEWMGKVERPIAEFAKSNRIELIRFQTVGFDARDVCVWAKDAPRMREFVMRLPKGPSFPTQAEK